MMPLWLQVWVLIWAWDWLLHFVSSGCLGGIACLLTWIILSTYYAWVSRSPWKMWPGTAQGFCILCSGVSIGLFVSRYAHLAQDYLLNWDWTPANVWANAGEIVRLMLRAR